MIYTAPRPPGLKNLGMPWRPEELQQLEQLVQQGLSASRIAEIMERSVIAIRAKAASKKLRLRARRPPRPAGRRQTHSENSHHA